MTTIPVPTSTHAIHRTRSVGAIPFSWDPNLDDSVVDFGDCIARLKEVILGLDQSQSHYLRPSDRFYYCINTIIQRLNADSMASLGDRGHKLRSIDRPGLGVDTRESRGPWLVRFEFPIDADSRG